MVLTCLVLVLLQVNLFVSESQSAQQGDTAIQQDDTSKQSHPQKTLEDKNLLNQKLQRFLTDITFRGHFTTDKKVLKTNFQSRTNTPLRLQPM